MSEEPAFDTKPTGAVRIIEEHWPSAVDGTPLLPVESDQLTPLLTEQEWQEWQQARAEDKAWQLANWDKWCRELENLFK